MSEFGKLIEQEIPSLRRYARQHLNGSQFDPIDHDPDFRLLDVHDRRRRAIAAPHVSG